MLVKDKNVVFMGTPDFAVPVLEMLIEKTNVIMVVTQPDKEVGRKKELVYSPVKKVALEHKIPVFQPIKIRRDYEELKKYRSFLKHDFSTWNQILIDIDTLRWWFRFRK